MSKKLPECKNPSCRAKYVKKYPLQRACSTPCEAVIRDSKKTRRDAVQKSKDGALGAEEQAGDQGGGGGNEKRPQGLRKTPVRKKSERQRDEEAELALIKSVLVEKYGERCMSCGKPGPVDLSHLIKRQEKRFVLDPRNLVLQGSSHTGTCLCHDNWEVRDYSEVAKFINFSEILARIRSMDEGKFWRFVHRFEKQGFVHDFK
jgi:hypothetical protein